MSVTESAKLDCISPFQIKIASGFRITIVVPIIIAQQQQKIMHLIVESDFKSHVGIDQNENP